MTRVTTHKALYKVNGSQLGTRRQVTPRKTQEQSVGRENRRSSLIKINNSQRRIINCMKHKRATKTIKSISINCKTIHYKL